MPQITAAMGRGNIYGNTEIEVFVLQFAIEIA
jgi:hypothetical protein